MDLSAGIHQLNNRSLALSERLQTAQRLVHQLLQHTRLSPAAAGAQAASAAAAPAPAAAAAAPAAAAAVPPLPVLVHYVKVLVDALQGLLLKPPQGATQADLSPCWALLSDLVAHGGPLLTSSSINANICSAACTAVNSTITSHCSSSTDVVQSLTVLFAALSSSSSSSSSQCRGFRCPASVINSFRASLDQQAALLAAVLTQHWQQWQQQQQCQSHTYASTQDQTANAAAAAEAWSHLSTILLKWFTSSAVMQTNAKKVYAVILADLFEPLIATATLQDTLCSATPTPEVTTPAATAAAAAAAQELLVVVLFDQQHLGGLCGVVAGAAALQLDAASAPASTAAAAAATDAVGNVGAATATTTASIDNDNDQDSSAVAGFRAKAFSLLNPDVTALLAKTYQGGLLLRLKQLVDGSLLAASNSTPAAAAATAAAVAGGDIGSVSSSGKKRRRQQQQQQQQQQQGSDGVPVGQVGAAASKLPARSVLCVLPMLLQGFSNAVRKYSKTLQQDAAAVLAATGQTPTAARQQQQVATADAQQQDGAGPAAACGMGTIVSAVDTHFSVCLLSLLLPHLTASPTITAAAAAAVDSAHGSQAGKTGGSRKRQRLHESSKGVDGATAAAAAAAAAATAVSEQTPAAAAALLHAVRACGSYRPTQDTGGRVKGLLQLAADALALQQQQQQQQQSVVAASASLAVALLDVEYRVLLPHMPLLFELAWQAAALEVTFSSNSSSSSSSGSDSNARDSYECGGSGNRSSIGGGSRSSTAAQLLCHLFRAYSELRQLDTLLRSLYEALPMSGMQHHQQQHQQQQQEQHTGVLMSDAAAVLGSGEVLTAVRTVVATAPMGQAPALVSAVRHCIHTLHTNSSGSSSGSSSSMSAALPLLSTPLAAVLDALPLDLTTAAAVAAAAEQLLAALSTCYSHQLVRAAAGAAAAAEGDVSMLAADADTATGDGATGWNSGHVAVLLSLYAAAVRLHSKCAALNPEVKSLPGHQVNPDIIDAVLQQRRLGSTPQKQQQQQQQQQQQELQLDQDDYFDALFAAASGTAHDHLIGSDQQPSLLLPMLALRHAANEQQQQQQEDDGDASQLQKLLLPCMLQRLHVLQQRLLRVQFWCPAGLSLTAARKQQQGKKGGRAAGSMLAAGAAGQHGHPGEDTAAAAAGGEAGGEDSGDDDLDAVTLEQQDSQQQQQQQHLQRLRDVWYTEGQQLVRLLLAPLLQELAFGASPQPAAAAAAAARGFAAAAAVAAEQYVLLASHIQTWSAFADSAQLSSFICVGLGAFMQQQQQQQQQQQTRCGQCILAACGAQLLGLPKPGLSTAAAAAAAGDAVLPDWLLNSAAQHACLTAVGDCLQQSLAVLSTAAAVAAAAAGGGSANTLAADGSMLTPSDSAKKKKKKNKQKPELQQKQPEAGVGSGPAAPAAAAAAKGIAGLADLLGEVNLVCAPASSLSSSSSPSAAAAAGESGYTLDVLMQQHWQNLVPQLLSWHGLSPPPAAAAPVNRSSPSLASPMQQQQHADLLCHLWVLQSWLLTVGQLPLQGVQQQVASQLSVLVLTAAAAAAYVAVELGTPEGLQSAAAASKPPAAATAAAAGFPAAAGQQQYQQQMRSSIAQIFSTVLKVLARADLQGCGLAQAFGVLDQAGAKAGWQQLLPLVLVCCSLMVPTAAAAAATAVTDAVHTDDTSSSSSSIADAANAAWAEVLPVAYLLLRPQIMPVPTSAAGGSTKAGSSAAAAAASTDLMQLAQQQLQALVGSQQEGRGVRDAIRVQGANGATTDPQQLQQQAACVAALLSAPIISFPETAAASAGSGAGASSSEGVTQKALMLLQQLALPPASTASLPAAAAGVVYHALSHNTGLLKQLATQTTTSSSSSGGSVLQELTACAVAHFLHHQEQQEQQEGAISGSTSELQLLQTVAFINAAHLTLTRSASSTAAPAAPDATAAADTAALNGSSISSTSCAAVVHNSMLLLDALVPSTPCWPGLPPDYVTMDDVIAAGTAGVTRVTPSSSSSSVGQQHLLTAGVLVGLRDVVAVAPRQLLLQLHQLLVDSTVAYTTGTVPQHQQRQQQLLSWLQLLLVVLEASHGPQSLTLVSSHSSHYCTALINIITQTQLLLPTNSAIVASANGLPAAGVMLAQLQQQQQLAAVSWAMRCLESMVGREATFHLPSTTTAAIMASITSVLQQLLQLMTASTGGSNAAESAGLHAVYLQQQQQLVSADAVTAVYHSSCNVLVALLRHRATSLQRQMHMMNAAIRALLLLLLAADRSLMGELAWGHISRTATGGFDHHHHQQQQQSIEGLHQRAELLVRCGGQLGRVYEALAEQGQQLGRQCHYIITDYVMHVAAAAPASLAGLLAAAAAAVGQGIGVVRPLGGTTTTPAAAARDQQLMSAVSTEVESAVRRGVCLLFGVLRPAEVQAVHQVISQGPLGGVRRDALAGLRAEFEAQHRHSGKV